MRKCIGDLHLFIEKHGDMLKMEFPALANLRVDECLGKYSIAYDIDLQVMKMNTMLSFLGE